MLILFKNCIKKNYPFEFVKKNYIKVIMKNENLCKVSEKKVENYREMNEQQKLEIFLLNQ